MNQQFKVENKMSVNPSRRKNWKVLHITTYPHNFGILIPSLSGVIWEQQTCGVMCNHVQIEGIFIPLKKPVDFYVPKNKQESSVMSLLISLKRANYNADYSKAEKVWEKIKEVMHFDFEEVPNPDTSKYPDTQEGLMWIKIKKFESGWGHGSWVKQFDGMTVILIYPNCD